MIVKLVVGVDFAFRLVRNAVEVRYASTIESEVVVRNAVVALYVNIIGFGVLVRIAKAGRYANITRSNHDASCVVEVKSVFMKELKVNAKIARVGLFVNTTN